MTHDTPLILPFTGIRAADLPKVGGKGANLGELAHAGFPVPPGFCLTTTAFQSFMDACPDPEALYAMLETPGSGEIEALRQAGARIRSTLLAVPVPPAVAAAVREAWQEAGREHAYAVRSSATAEDLPQASFAGQQDTFLNVRGAESLLDAVRRCWVSLFTDRAILYRAKNGFPHREVQLSVIVQRMVPAETSGILFTADPLTGHRHTLAIDASFGLGEALVGGLVTPDTYRVDKRTGAVIERRIADKVTGILAQEGGGTRQVALEEAQRKQAALTESQVLALAELGTRIETHYGSPQDIEWAIVNPESVIPSKAQQSPSPSTPTNQGIYILQSRPITSLYPIEGLPSPDGSLHVYFSLGHQQSMTRAMAPLSLSSVQLLMPIGRQEGGAGNTVVRASAGRLFADITIPLRHPVLRRGILGLLSQLDALAPEAARQVIRRPEFRRPHGLRPSFGSLRWVSGLFRRVLGSLWWRNLSGFRARTNALMDDFVEETSRRLAAESPRPARLQAVRETLPQVFPFFLNWVPEAAAGIAATRLLPRLARRWLSVEQCEALTLGIPGNVVNEMNLAIGDMADLARETPQLAAACSDLGADGQTWLQQAAQIPGSGPFIAAWEAFMARYGMRGPAEIDILMPRWHEDPLPLLQVIAGAVQNQAGAHRARQEAFIRGRQAAFEALLAKAGRGPLGWARARLFSRLYHTMTEVGGMREHHKLLAVRILGVVKNALREMAGQLVAEGKLQQADDLWFLTWDELPAIWEGVDQDWEGLVAKRRADLDRWQQLTPPLIVTSDGESPAVRYRVEDAPPGALLGNPVSMGVVEGVAHVIRDPQREQLAPGEILVAEFTDPGWTPLFINASGLVLEVGGPLTHGAVVAREYGIPAIVGVRGATGALQTGQRVRVDGNRGVVEVL